MDKIRLYNMFIDSDYFNSSGIFKALFTAYGSTNLPFLESSDVAESLDTEYFMFHSGSKYQSIYLQHLYDIIVDTNGGSFSDVLAKLISTLYIKFNVKWNKLFEAINTEYDPLENYSMTESENVNSSITTTLSNGASMHGFNSPDSVPTNESESTSTTSGSSDDNIRNLTRSGNIGVTTSQQMLESEFEVRKHDFYEIVMNDIDSVIANNIFNV